MLVVYLVGFLGVNCDILFDQKMLELTLDYTKEDNLVSCVEHILKQYYVSEEQLTFVEIGYDDDHLLQAVHAQALLGVIHRKPISTYFPYNRAYLVTSGNVTDFTQNFMYITQEPSWNPYAKFIVVVRSIKEVELRQIFDILMKYYVLNVLVINGTDPYVYTYNPYEDYACGKYYNRIINFGRCPTLVDLYPNKLITGLRRCKVTITVAHWPPYTMHPSRIKHGMSPEGVEQFVMRIIAEREQFNITYLYKDFGEEYSKISSRMTATGPLQMLQNNETDLMMGGMVLTPLRAAAFAYTCYHLDLADDVKIIVKRASYTPIWKNFYLEFEPKVWLLLLFSLVAFGIIMILLLQIQNKCYFFLMLLDMLLLHGRDIHYRWRAKYIFIFWLWFVYLLNCFYQSNLSSLSTKPVRDVQVSDIQDLDSFNIRPCLSSVIKLLLRDRNISMSYDNTTECESFYGSIRTISETYRKYTIALYSVYFYQSDRFFDEYGNNLVYIFKNSLFKVSYSIFMNKGFPLEQRLRLLTIRLRENGLVVKDYDYQYIFLKLINHYKQEEFEVRFAVPWYLYSFGLLVSTTTFVIEIVSKLKAFQRD